MRIELKVYAYQHDVYDTNKLLHPSDYFGVLFMNY